MRECTLAEDLYHVRGIPAITCQLDAGVNVVKEDCSDANHVTTILIRTEPPTG